MHDFHLMLVPGDAPRRRRPDLAIGFFLHTPFPSSEVYRLLPTRQELLRGVLGADYVSFQVGDYARHFRSSCLRILGIDSEPDWLELDGRRVGIGVDPIGIDVEGFRKVIADPETARLLGDLEKQYEGRRLVLGVERLDYTKGIPQKLHAFERFLEQDPERARTTTMIQVVVPSRLESAEYRAQRDEIELLISRINGRFGQPGATPVEYLHRDVSKPGLVALYRRADVMMVTALRDGMNLVAQEFVLCQSEPGLPSRWRGALLLSELAGSAQVLPGALLVNPWDVDGVVEHLATALELPARERRRRLETMSDRVEALDVRRWADGFLARMTRYSRRDRRTRRPPTVDPELEAALLRRFARARERTILLDYDGTLRELERHPDLAQPTPEIRALLRSLAALPATSVHIVSGRRSRNLEQWFGRLPIYLCAEHGYLARAPGGEWRDAPRARPHLDASRSSGSCGGLRPMFPERTSSGSRAASPGTTGRPSRSTARGGRASSSTTCTSSLRARRRRSSSGIKSSRCVRSASTRASTSGASSRTGRNRGTSSSVSVTTGPTTICSMRFRPVPSPAMSAACCRPRTREVAGAWTSTSSGRARFAHSSAISCRASRCRRAVPCAVRRRRPLPTARPVAQRGG